jgi:hypothetical protein
MKAFLLYPDRDLDLEAELPPNEDDLRRDLELDTLFGAMAAGDEFLLDVARRVVLTGLDEPDEIVYRQEVLRDCLEHPALVRTLYDLAVEAITGEKGIYFGLFRASPDTILSRSVQVLEFFVPLLRRLRGLAEEHAAAVRSPGLRRLFAMLEEELEEDYLQGVEAHLGELRFRRGVLLSARLGRGNKGVELVLRRPHERRWHERLLGERSGLSFQIADRDESGFRALSELRGRGLNTAANAVAQSADHVLGFFRMLRVEFAFYLGCLNLSERLAEKGEPTCFPEVAPPVPTLRARGLYDPCLSLQLEGRAVGNEVEAVDTPLLVVTGANQGGKSTFLRSAGLAQLMLQAGMVVAAEGFAADLRDGVYTHFKREEDVEMERGKLDEELARMSEIADRITPRSLLLCNESFASTNEREGSELARQVIRALVESGVKVVFVTHLYDLASGLCRRPPAPAVFLRAPREEDGRRTYRLAEGEPLPTSFGPDAYRTVFGAEVPRGAGEGSAPPVEPRVRAPSRSAAG